MKTVYEIRFEDINDPECIDSRVLYINRKLSNAESDILKQIVKREQEKNINSRDNIVQKARDFIQMLGIEVLIDVQDYFEML